MRQPCLVITIWDFSKYLTIFEMDLVGCAQRTTTVSFEAKIRLRLVRGGA
jgi:hypothetical protein